MKNEFGVALDRAGYAPSIMQPKAPHVALERVGARTVTRCALCRRSWGFGLDGKLDRHEPWGGTANRKKSMALGMWVLLCRPCHEKAHGLRTGRESSVSESRPERRKEGAHVQFSPTAETERSELLSTQLRKDAQRAAMLRYGWTRDEFIRRFGKSELNEDEAKRLLPKSVDKPRVRAVRASASGFRVIEDAADLPF